MLSTLLSSPSQPQQSAQIKCACLCLCVSDTVAFRSLSSLEIKHYAFQAVDVMTTCLYLISPESLQSSGGGALAWLLFRMTRN